MEGLIRDRKEGRRDNWLINCLKSLQHLYSTVALYDDTKEMETETHWLRAVPLHQHGGVF